MGGITGIRDRAIRRSGRLERGSRKHVLAWTESPDFLSELLQTVAPVKCSTDEETAWMPRGRVEPREARLESFGPRVLPSDCWKTLSRWWLVHHRGANTPNWDLAVRCQVEGRPGLVLVEAKAHVRELSDAGKGVSKGDPLRSGANHDRIDRAIAEARSALNAEFPQIAIARDRSYQLSNRIAFAWKLASLGVPTVLLYLGFVGDNGMATPLRNADHWKEVLEGHFERV